jgi:threonine/homoserine/homoserine lactone efflux protein
MNPALIKLITSGIFLGTIAGISPGPLLTLVISESLLNGRKAGIRMALVPAITDLPIVLVSVFILSRLSAYQTILGIISMAGSVFLLYLAYGSLFFKGRGSLKTVSPKRTFAKGILANFLSPHPYLFWMLIGGSILMESRSAGWYAPALFLFLFYLCLIGSKIIIAWLSSRFADILHARWYLYTIRFLGFLLLLFAVYFFIEGVNYIF